jgi:hypothetical protein
LSCKAERYVRKAVTLVKRWWVGYLDVKWPLAVDRDGLQRGSLADGLQKRCYVGCLDADL